MTDTKQLLLEATRQLIATKGCSRMTMQDIMNATNLSKGAIYHYVKGKDELLALVLRAQLQETHEQFMSEVDHDAPSLAGPLAKITQFFPSMANAKDVTTQIFLYLTGRQDQPTVQQLLAQFHEEALAFAQRWIEEGQRAGVIDETLDSRTTADLFVMMTYGLRMRSAMSPQQDVPLHDIMMTILGGMKR